MPGIGPLKVHGANWKHPNIIDPGNEPPLSVDGPIGEPIDRRHVSIVWLSGIVLTAISGASLMAAAVLASLKGAVNIASYPQEVALRGTLGFGAAHRADRLPLPAMAFHRQIIRLSTVSRINDHEVVRARRFVRLTGNLSLARSRVLDQIPPLNPQRLLAQSAPGGNAPPQAEPSAEVSFVVRDLWKLLPKVKLTIVTPPDQVRARVRRIAAWQGGTTTLSAKSAAITGMKLAYAGSRDYSSLIAPIVPTNVTTIPKTSTTTNGGTRFERQIIEVKNGESAASILRGIGATPDQTTVIDKLLGSYGSQDGLTAGDRLRVLLSPIGKKHLEPVRVVVANNSGPEAAVALSNAGNYVSVDPDRIDRGSAERHDDQPKSRVISSGISLYQSFYETALRHHVPHAIINDFLRIFAFDVDFARRVHPGNSFAVLYSGDKRGPTASNLRNDVLFASLTVDGRTKTLYRFRADNTAPVDYYNPRGETVQTFLLRKPVPVGRLTSGFGWRKHPILGVVLMHTGIDWAAPMGTPVYAAGDGVIEREGWESGYGKFMLLRHAYGFETAYAHLSGYARGTHVGEHVRQGQVIAFVGSTGYSTGPHLNFEFRLNGHFVDPLRIKLPHEHVLRGAELVRFRQMRKRLNMVMTNNSLHASGHS